MAFLKNICIKGPQPTPIFHNAVKRVFKQLSLLHEIVVSEQNGRDLWGLSMHITWRIAEATGKIREMLSLIDSWVERARRRDNNDEWMDEDKMKQLKEMVRKFSISCMMYTSLS